MRCLNTSTYELTNDDDPEFRADPRYAILSHRWVGPEISFQTLRPGDLIDRRLQTPQLNKIRGACAKARQEKPPLKWLWDDTCCIDKTNAVEESRSINSMFEWYSSAVVCYTYLHDVVWSGPSVTPSVQMFKRQDEAGMQSDLESEWFERGWTLQELLAPRHLEFYDREWRFMGTKKHLASILQAVTGINGKYLTGENPIQTASIANRMSWMAGRNTKEVEDIAYSMLGILGITMTPQYGEGKNAFMRLQKTLMETSPDESIFAWALPTEGLVCFRKFGCKPPEWSPQTWGILAPSPDCFKMSSDVIVIQEKIVPRLKGGYRWTQQGVQFEMSIKPGTEATNMFGLPRGNFNLPLNCWTNDSSGTLTTIVLRLIKTNNGYLRELGKVLDKKKNAKPSTNQVLGIDQVLTRPLIIMQPNLG